MAECCVPPRFVSFRLPHCLEKVSLSLSLPLSLSLRRGEEGDTRAPRFAGDIAGIMAILIFRAAARFHRGAKTRLFLLLPLLQISFGGIMRPRILHPPPFSRLRLLAPVPPPFPLFSIDYRPWLASFSPPPPSLLFFLYLSLESHPRIFLCFASRDNYRCGGGKELGIESRFL